MKTFDNDSTNEFAASDGRQGNAAGFDRPGQIVHPAGNPIEARSHFLDFEPRLPERRAWALLRLALSVLGVAGGVTCCLVDSLRSEMSSLMSWMLAMIIAAYSCGDIDAHVAVSKRQKGGAASE